jgi:hypothetical protein
VPEAILIGLTLFGSETKVSPMLSRT